jgi:hypothetical protein
MCRKILSTHEKALQINLDQSKYGTFAEIGAGQEVTRWFFSVGGAAGTVAKSISAYDMVVSDAIYGACEHYVGRRRLKAMLDHEYDLLEQRLRGQRGANTRFFAFADTVAARGYRNRDECHGWMGIRFQTVPGAAYSQVIIHVRMLDQENLQQQEALGVLGVNLIHGALYYPKQPERFIASLLDNLTSQRVEVDMIKFYGHGFESVDNRLMSLQLVQQGLTDAAMFTAKGDVVQAAEILYKKPILIERGSFRPVTNVTLDMLECARAQFVQEPGRQGTDPLVLMEMTLKNLADGGTIKHQDFLDRADLLGSLGKTVLVSNYGEFHRLAAYLFRYTKKPIGIALGVPTLRELFEEKYYADLQGGILESFGRLFKKGLRLYVYPSRDPATGDLITADTLKVVPQVRQLYAYLLENGFIEPIRGYNESYLPIFSRDVLARLQTGDGLWEQLVPGDVVHIIKERKLFGWREADASNLSLSRSSSVEAPPKLEPV